MMDLFIVVSYNCQRNMTKIWAGMIEQLFDLVLVQYLIYLARMPSPFLYGGGGLSPNIFEECCLIFLAGREKQKKSIHTHKNQ